MVEQRSHGRIDKSGSVEHIRYEVRESAFNDFEIDSEKGFSKCVLSVVVLDADCFRDTKSFVLKILNVFSGAINTENR
jgi:hypothetical protein